MPVRCVHWVHPAAGAGCGMTHLPLVFCGAQPTAGCNPHPQHTQEVLSYRKELVDVMSPREAVGVRASGPARAGHTPTRLTQLAHLTVTDSVSLAF